jgi:hypothetical protein
MICVAFGLAYNPGPSLFGRKAHVAGANEAVREGLGARREAGSQASCRRGDRSPCFGRVAAGAVAAALISPLAASGVTDLEPGPVDIQILSPRPGEVVKNRVHMAPVRGAARSGTGDPVDFDVLIVLDVSHSTRYPSGIDIDEDGEIGFNPQAELIAPGSYPEDLVCSDSDDTILAAEIRAARYLVEVLGAGRTRVGIVAFSGEVDPKTGRQLRADQKDAWVEIPLTRDFEAVNRTLDSILERGPHGATNYAAAVQLSVVELAGLPGARSAPRSSAKKVVLFLTDGVPTFPFGKGIVADTEDTEVAINASRLARKAGITINTYALGRHALASPVAVIEMARLTVGTYTPVRNPGDIVSFLQGISFANVDDVIITNLTTSEISYDVQLAPDGSFSAFVPVREGSNRVQVTALASDGGEQSVELDVNFEKSGLSERELTLELERIKKRNKELLRLIERQRIQSFRDRQQKRVEIEAEQQEP